MPNNLLTKVKNYSILKLLQLESIPVRSEDHSSCFVDELARQNYFQREISKFTSKDSLEKEEWLLFVPYLKL